MLYPNSKFSLPMCRLGEGEMKSVEIFKKCSKTKELWSWENDKTLMKKIFNLAEITFLDG